MDIKRQRIIWVTFFSCLIIQIFIQSHSLVFHDILWSIEVGKRLFAGGTYAKDFFETNPPLLYFFHGTLGWLSAFIHVKPVTFFYGFIIFTTTIVFVSCHILSKQLLKEDQTARFCLLMALAISLGIAVNASYGQKEQIMILFALPYFFIHMGYQLNKSVQTWVQVLAGLFAGIGFAFKPPFFFLAPLLVEFALILSRRQITTLFRPDVFAIIIVQLIYLLSILIITPSYFKIVLPVILTTYVPEQYVSLMQLFINEVMVFFYLSLIAWFFCYQKGRLNKIIIVWFWVALGFAVSYVLQSKGWHYQGLPLCVIEMLFASLVFLSGLRKFQNQTIERRLVILSFSFIILIFYIAPVYVLAKFKISVNSTHNHRFWTMIEEVGNNAGPERSLFMFTTHMQSIYFMHYANMSIGSRFGSIWPLPGLLNNEKRQNFKILNMVKEAITEDFKRFQPSLVLVNQPQYSYIKNRQFDYIELMKSNKTFNQLWKNYQYLKQIDYGPFFVFDLYKKKPYKQALN
jgi:hypothetical protein